MSYANPNYFSLITASVIMLALFYLWAMRRRRVLSERFAERNLINNIAPSVSMRRKALKILMLAAAVSLSLIALARPQWGFEWEETRRSGLDMLIALDVSKSMLATDVRPNRLERSKLAVKDLVKKLNGDRIGLIAFAGTAFLQCPLTIDYNGFLLALDDISVDTIPRGGTSISSAVQEAMKIFKSPDKKYKVLVIITDGEDFEGDSVKAARDASLLGVKIYCIGVGTKEGSIIQAVGSAGEREYVVDRSGAVVKTKLNEETLKNIAISTGGSYIHATQGEFGLVLLYDRIISKLEKHDIETKMRKHYQERFQNFLMAAVILLLLEPLISDRKRTV